MAMKKCSLLFPKPPARLLAIFKPMMMSRAATPHWPRSPETSIDTMMGLSEKFVFCVMRNSPESLEISFFLGAGRAEEM